jgi:hypothetical protein
MSSRSWCSEFVSGAFYGGVMTTKRRKRINGLVCPGCSEIGTLRKIVYGMPDPEVFDFEKYAVGGCCINGDGSDPDVKCRNCEWEGFRDDLPTHN